MEEIKAQKLYEDIDTLLGETESACQLGSIALGSYAETSNCSNSQIMADKIKTFAAVIIPVFPKMV